MPAAVAAVLATAALAASVRSAVALASARGGNGRHFFSTSGRLMYVVWGARYVDCGVDAGLVRFGEEVSCGGGEGRRRAAVDSALDGGTARCFPFPCELSGPDGLRTGALPRLDSRRRRPVDSLCLGFSGSAAGADADAADSRRDSLMGRPRFRGRAPSVVCSSSSPDDFRLGLRRPADAPVSVGPDAFPAPRFPRLCCD